MNSQEHLIKTEELNELQKKSMLKIMHRHFDQVNDNIFHRDLERSQFVIIIEDVTSHEIVGFSTQTILKTEFDGRRIVAIYSGDTIVGKEYFRGISLAGSWICLVKKISDENAGSEIYWFLLSKGYVTYMLLPKNFYEFYPRYDKKTPDSIKQALDKLGELKFGSGYNPETGTIKIENNYYLKNDIGQIRINMKKNHHINFFSQINPNHIRGIELACIVPLNEANFKENIKKIYNG